MGKAGLPLFLETFAEDLKTESKNRVSLNSIPTGIENTLRTEKPNEIKYSHKNRFFQSMAILF